nr:MAG TPA: hypothetical protein [Caudoviricetes sp.]
MLKYRVFHFVHHNFEKHIIEKNEKYELYIYLMSTYILLYFLLMFLLKCNVQDVQNIL